VEPSFLSGEPVTVIIDTPAAAPPPPEPEPAVAAPVLRSELRCAACQDEMTRNTAMVVSGKQVCMLCASQMSAPPVETARLSSHLPAAVGGLVGALLGAAVFAIVGIATDHAIGYIAVLVGFLAGRGVHMGARGAFAPSLQLLAAGLAVFGIVASKFFMLSYYVIDRLGMSAISGRLFIAFGHVFTDMLSPFDILWVGLAVAAAARASKPSVTR
jgi:hypothetical protein